MDAVGLAPSRAQSGWQRHRLLYARARLVLPRRPAPDLRLVIKSHPIGVVVLRRQFGCKSQNRQNAPLRLVTPWLRAKADVSVGIQRGSCQYDTSVGKILAPFQNRHPTNPVTMFPPSQSLRRDKTARARELGCKIRWQCRTNAQTATTPIRDKVRWQLNR
jgi:hypothetical protein